VKHNLPSGSSTGQQKSEIRADVRRIIGERLDFDYWQVDRETFLDRMERLVTLVSWWGTQVNLTAEPHNSRELGFHILDSLAPLSHSRHDQRLQRVFDAASFILDLGSGAGFPGLVLASASLANFTLLERRRKRASFLAIAVADMGLTNVTVEQSLPSAKFDAVTARAFARAPLFYSAASAALKRGGVAILYANASQNLALHEAECEGLSEPRFIRYTLTRNMRAAQRVLVSWRRV
jgi:16S rRNA (guanine527-N7)-methyltransferase